MKYVLVRGTPVDGLEFVGPFPTYEKAKEYLGSERHVENQWIAELNEPMNEEKHDG